MICRPLTGADTADARTLYQTLSTGESLPTDAAAAFDAVLAHPGTTVFGAQAEGCIVSMATLHLLPNMTYNARPYGLVENVATLPAYQRQGFARHVMTTVAEAAWAQGAYKIMLLTGQANAALGFYQALGYDADEKHGLILRAPAR